MTAPPQIRFQPGLEGLRGISVAAVLLFHAELPWAVGGYLGVSTFFTLSGFLITSLLLADREAGGRVRLGAFWVRRFRRLMPAALACLAAIAVLGPLLGTPQQLQSLRGDVLWALGYLVNWHLLAADVAYAQIFAAPSPVQHFWSLAIEEQFYALFPLLAAVALHRSPRVLTLAAAVGVASSVAAGWLLFAGGASLDRIYYGTDTRAAEFLLGALLVPLAGHRVEASGARALSLAGAAALATALVLWSSVDVSSPWLYRGGFALNGLLSAVVIAAAIQPAGPVRRLLSLRPVRWLGKVSYGAYLYHWPIFLWLSPDRMGLSPWTNLGTQLAATLLLAGASHRWLEEPIRRGRRLSGARAWVAAPAAGLAVVLAAVAIGAPSPAGLDFAEASFELPPGEADHAAPDAPRIALYGDSTAQRLNTGLFRWTLASEAARPANGVHMLGCGVDQGGWRRHRGKEVPVPPVCAKRSERWARSLQEQQPDMAVVLTGTWEVADRRLPGDRGWRQLGDPVFDAYLRQELLAAVDVLSARGAIVVWLTSPSIERGWRAREGDPRRDPVRMARFNELVHELETLRPGVVYVIDFAGYVEGLPERFAGARLRPDGVHLTDAAALHVSEWLGPELVALYERVGRGG